MLSCLAAPGEPPGRDDLAGVQQAASGLRTGACPQHLVLPGRGPALRQVLWEDTDPPPAGGEAGNCQGRRGPRNPKEKP